MAAVQLFEHKPEDVLTGECRGKILRIIAQDPDVSQRELGISLSRADFCLRALIEKGWIKVGNFKNSNNKKAYIYLPSGAGITAKSLLSARFVQRKALEYEALFDAR